MGIDSLNFDTEIAICGAGIAGLALACALSREGYQVALLEAGQRPTFPTQGVSISDWDRRVSALTPSSADFLESLGVWSRLEQGRMSPYQSMTVWDAEGTGSINFSAGEAGVSWLGHIVENRLTVDALLAAVETAAGVACFWETSIDGLDCDEAGHPVVRTAAGQCWRAKLVIGADGARSRLRELAEFKVRRWSYRQKAIVSTIALDTDHGATCWQAFLPTGPLALLPLAQSNLCSIVWSLDEQVCDHWAACDDEAFVDGLNAIVANRGLRVTETSSRAVFPLHQCHSIDYIQPRVALVADAAHSIHPLAGQGINLGLSDVRVLCEELTRARSAAMDPGSEVALKRYQRRRKGENLALMAAMEAFKRGFGSDLPLLRVARNVGLSWVDGFMPLKQWFVRQALR